MNLNEIKLYLEPDASDIAYGAIDHDLNSAEQLPTVKINVQFAPNWHLKHAHLDPEAVGLLPYEIASRHSVVVIDVKQYQNQPLVVIASAHNANEWVVKHIRKHLPPKSIVFMKYADINYINKAISFYYHENAPLHKILAQITDRANKNKNDQNGFDFLLPYPFESIALSDNRRQEPYNDDSYVLLLNSLLLDAIKKRASDIHITPIYDHIIIKYRIDGIIHPQYHLPKTQTLLNRIKVVGNMNISLMNAPQQGRIRIIKGIDLVDFRASTHPTIFGENVVLRVLPQGNRFPDLGELGFSIKAQKFINSIVNKPEGLFIIAGPTGSGKTTTLYSILSHLIPKTKNIMTLEDPVEYRIENIQQTDINDSKYCDFAQGIRSVLRQDPDVLLIGEIRDSESASMAVRAAQTGHKVFTTLHVNSVFNVTKRLQELGINPQALDGHLNGMMTQRLVRKICRECKGDGCDDCNSTGYKGRVAIAEILAEELYSMKESIAELLAKGETTKEQIRNTIDCS